MIALRKIPAVIAVLIAAAVIFSPLAGAVLGSGLELKTFGTAFQGVCAPLGKSLGLALVSACVAFILGAPFAILVERSRVWVRRALWGLGLLVFIVPPYMAGQAWIVLLGPAGKLSKGVAVLLGAGPYSNDPIALARFAVPDLVYTWPSVGVVMGGCFFPIVALAVASAYRRTDRRIFESARLARGMAGVWEIAVQVLIPPAVGAALLVFAATLTEFAVPQLLRVRTVGEAIYEQIQEGDLAAASALSLPLLPLIVLAGAMGAYVLARSRVASMASLEGEVPRFTVRKAGALNDLLAALVTLFSVTPGLIFPMLSLVWLVATAKLPAASALGSHKVLRASGFLDSLQGAWDLAHEDAVRTVLMAGLTATLAIAAAIVLARLASRAGISPLLGSLSAGLAVPAPLVGLGLITLWNGGWGRVVYHSVAVVMLAWLARFLPLVIFLSQSALARVPRELESAAALGGRGPFERIIAVVLPNAAPGLVAAWLAMYILAATEFCATLLVAPPGSPLLAPSIVNLMRRGQDSEIAACQFLLLGVIALPLIPLMLALIVRSRSRFLKTNT